MLPTIQHQSKSSCCNFLLRVEVKPLQTVESTKECYGISALSFEVGMGNFCRQGEITETCLIVNTYNVICVHVTFKSLQGH